MGLFLAGQIIEGAWGCSLDFLSYPHPRVNTPPPLLAGTGLVMAGIIAMPIIVGPKVARPTTWRDWL